MLSKDRQQSYQQFRQALEQMQRALRQGNLDRAALLADWKEVQQYFGSQILRLGNEEFEVESPQELSYLTEIHKQLRLLGIDWNFLQVSGSAAADARKAAIAHRIDALIGYCDALLPQDEG